MFGCLIWENIAEFCICKYLLGWKLKVHYAKEQNNA